jgi:hypothetical protein
MNWNSPAMLAALAAIDAAAPRAAATTMKARIEHLVADDSEYLRSSAAQFGRFDLSDAEIAGACEGVLKAIRSKPRQRQVDIIDALAMTELRDAANIRAARKSNAA